MLQSCSDHERHFRAAGSLLEWAQRMQMFSSRQEANFIVPMVASRRVKWIVCQSKYFTIFHLSQGTLHLFYRLGRAGRETSLPSFMSTKIMGRPRDLTLSRSRVEKEFIKALSSRKYERFIFCRIQDEGVNSLWKVSLLFIPHWTQEECSQFYRWLDKLSFF